MLSLLSLMQRVGCKSRLCAGGRTRQPNERLPAFLYPPSFLMSGLHLVDMPDSGPKASLTALRLIDCAFRSSNFRARSWRPPSCVSMPPATLLGVSPINMTDRLAYSLTLYLGSNEMPLGQPVGVQCFFSFGYFDPSGLNSFLTYLDSSCSLIISSILNQNISLYSEAAHRKEITPSRMRKRHNLPSCMHSSRSHVGSLIPSYSIHILRHTKHFRVQRINTRLLNAAARISKSRSRRPSPGL